MIEIVRRMGDPVCGGGCGLSPRKHRSGCVFLGVIHYADRRHTHRSFRNLLLLVAQRRRMDDPEYLNIDLFDWFYVYEDSVTAARLAREAGHPIPARLWDDRRRLCRDRAAMRGVQLASARNRKVYRWAR